MQVEHGLSLGFDLTSYQAVGGSCSLSAGMTLAPCRDQAASPVSLLPLPPGYCYCNPKPHGMKHPHSKGSGWGPWTEMKVFWFLNFGFKKTESRGDGMVVLW